MGKIADKVAEIFTVKKTDNQFIYIVKSMVNRFDQHNITQTAGQFAYFSMLSIFPFIVLVNALIDKFKLSGEFVEKVLSEVFPLQVAETIGTYVDYVVNLGSGAGVISAGVIVALFSASKSVRSLSIAVNMALGINEKRFFLSRIIMSMFLTLILSVVIILCIIVATVGREWTYKIILLIDMPVSWLDGISMGKWVIVFVALLVLLTLVYWILPIRRVKFRSVIPGAVFALMANCILTYVYSKYVEYFTTFSLLYGSMGVVLFLALWLYFLGIFIIMGAELNGILQEKKYFYATKIDEKN